MFAMLAAVFSFANARVVEEMPFLQDGTPEPTEAPTPPGGDDNTANPRPWEKVVNFKEIKDGVYIMLYNAYYSNNRLQATGDDDCTFSSSKTEMNQMWKITKSNYGGVGNDKAWFLYNYIERDERYDGYYTGYCADGDEKQVQAWDFRQNQDDPEQYRLINSENQDYRLAVDADGEGYSTDGDFKADQWFYAKSPFMAKPKWIVADEFTNMGGGNMSVSHDFTMKTGFTKMIKNSVAMQSNSMPNVFTMTIEQTIDTVCSNIDFGGNMDYKKATGSVKMDVERASSNQYLKDMKVTYEVPAGEKVCLYQMVFDMSDAIYARPFKYQSELSHIATCKGKSMKGHEYPMSKISDNVQGKLLAERLMGESA